MVPDHLQIFHPGIWLNAGPPTCIEPQPGPNWTFWTWLELCFSHTKRVRGPGRLYSTSPPLRMPSMSKSHSGENQKWSFYFKRFLRAGPPWPSEHSPDTTGGSEVPDPWISSSVGFSTCGGSGNRTSPNPRVPHVVLWSCKCKSPALQ